MKWKNFLYLIGKREYVKERIDPFTLIILIVLDIIFFALMIKNIGLNIFLYYLFLWVVFTVSVILWFGISVKNIKKRLKKREKLIKEGEKYVGQIMTMDTTKVKGLYNRKYYNVLVKFRFGLDDRLVWSEELDFYPGDLKTSKVDIYVLDGEYIITHFR